MAIRRWSDYFPLQGDAALRALRLASGSLHRPADVQSQSEDCDRLASCQIVSDPDRDQHREVLVDWDDRSQKAPEEVGLLRLPVGRVVPVEADHPQRELGDEAVGHPRHGLGAWLELGEGGEDPHFADEGEARPERLSNIYPGDNSQGEALPGVDGHRHDQVGANTQSGRWGCRLGGGGGGEGGQG